MCQCKCRKGDQGVQGIQGETGATGATGAMPTFTATELTLEAFAAAPIVKIITASASKTGTLYLWGHVVVKETDTSVLPTATVTPKISGAAVNHISVASIYATSLSVAVVSIPITASGAVTIGQPIDIEISLDDYGGVASVVIGQVFWYIA